MSAGPGRLAVQVVELSTTLDLHDGAKIRIARYGSWVADVATIAELEDASTPASTPVAVRTFFTSFKGERARRTPADS
jgi:hypothetical protein